MSIMITNREIFIKEILKLIKDEENGQQKYQNFTNELPRGDNWDSVRQALRNIASQERNHTVVLKHILANVE